MAADFVFTPEHPYAAKIEVEDTTINQLADGSELRLEQGETLSGTYTERYRMTGVELVSLLTFWKTRRLTTKFTKRSYDPSDPAFDPEDPADVDGPLETVRFSREPSWSMRGPDDYSVNVVFQRLPNE